ncbi:MAG: hypothetical protein QF472_06205 [Candidatus Marinimicrobia bacterium]|nr:hypothetical protein [Candidatus Neomarinimicrobiota bacterium]
MRRIHHILSNIFCAGVLWSFAAAQNISIDLNILNTSEFNMSSWQNVSDLWYVDIENPHSDPIEYYIRFVLKDGDEQELAWGKTKSLTISANTTEQYYNLDPVFNTNLLDEYDESLDFINNIQQQSGYLPPGNYSLELLVYNNEDAEISSDKESIVFTQGDNFDLLDENMGFPGEVVNEHFPVFAWSTPGFRQGIQLAFRLKIAHFDPEEGGLEDALENISNSVFYYDSGWDDILHTETGVSLDFYFTYPSTEDAFYCGYEYVWRIEAREVITGFNDGAGNQGLWGWPEPEKSVIRNFVYGETPTDLESPDGHDVLPGFSWRTIWCADDGYDIQITSIEDLTFEEKVYEGIQVPSGFTYPANASGLIPGNSYRWRVRINTPPGLTGWSQPGSFSVQPIELLEPLSGQVLETVRPTFNIEAPLNLSYYKIQIGDELDENVEIVEVYDGEHEITDFPWQYPSQNIENGLFPGMKYYWKLLLFDGSETGFPLGGIESYEVMGNFRIIPISLTQPTQGAANIPLNQKFTWEGPLSVPSYEFWLSDASDANVENPQVIVEIIGSKSYTYPLDGELPLEYEQKYYWRVVPKDINGYYGLPSSYSLVHQFTASDFPEMGEEVTTSSTDVRIPIINIDTVLPEFEYTIFIYEDSDGGSVVTEISGITSFPYTYSEGIETLNYGTTYYIQVQPTKNGESMGSPSNMMPFVIPEEPESTEQCEIVCEVTENEDPEILTTILEGLEEATDYLLLISLNEDMSNAIEVYISAGETQNYYSGDDIHWGQTYYTQIIALSDDERIGMPSDIQVVNVHSKPGADEQVAISVELPEGSTKPSFEIFNPITGASGYRITISTEPDLSVEFYQFDLLSGTQSSYPEGGPPLIYGTSYYIQAQGLDEDSPHGFSSSVVAIFIPNISPPILGEAFNWEATIPASEQYLLEVSKVEDFSAMSLSLPVQGVSSPVKMDELEYSTGYYWRVTGLDNGGNPFGNPSKVAFFTTEAFPSPELTAITEEASLTPTLSWSGIDGAGAYQISVASDGGMETLFWQEKTSNTSVTYPETATMLEFASNYYWQVTVISTDDLILSASPIGTFATKSIYPVQELSPNGGAETLTPTLQWEGNEKFKAYKLIIATDAELGSAVLEESVESSSFQVGEGLLLSGETYYWNVDGVDDNAVSLAGPSNTAMILMPSTDNIPLISPAGGSEVGNLNPVLKFGALMGVSNYSIRVATDAGFETLIIDDLSSGTEYAIPDELRLKNSTAYFWRIEGATETKTVISETGNFTTPAAAEINIQQLADGEVVSVKNPVFAWDAVEGVSAYFIRIADNNEFNNAGVFKTGTNSFKYPGEPVLETGKAYFWQLSPLNNEGNPIGSWTSPRSFTLTAVFLVELEIPENEAAITVSNPAFQWKAIEGVIKFEIQVSEINDFSELSWNSSEIIKNQTSYPESGSIPLEFGNIYFWRVRALGEGGPLGEFSSAYSFELSGSKKVTLEGPLGGESETLTPYFSWLSVRSAKNYSLTLASDEGMGTIIYTANVQDQFFQYPVEAPPLTNGIKYFWTVIAKDENGEAIGDHSDVGSFTTPAGAIEVEFIFGSGSGP